MMLKRIALVLLCMGSFSLGYSKKLSFYIVAHQDDWQLFMGEKAYREIKDPKNKVVILYLTSGEAGKDSSYWLARDRASNNALFFIKDQIFSDSITIRGNRGIGSHKIKYADYKNVRSYYMRLPDGHGRAGIGYEKYGMQSLKKLKAGEISTITCTDSSSKYESWNDVVQTIKGIITEESKGYNSIQVNFQEFDSSININSHSDHLATGQAVYEAVGDLKNIQKVAYVDYETKNKPVNLGKEDIMIKSAMFMVYDKCVFDKTGQCTICEGEGQYTQWLFRSYFRILK